MATRRQQSPVIIFAGIITVIALVRYLAGDDPGGQVSDRPSNETVAEMVPEWAEDELEAPRDYPVEMPDLLGMNATEAEEALATWELDIQASFHDMSVLHRDLDVWGAGIVWSTVPEAGEPVTAETDLILFTLQLGEYEFFKAHETMPRVTKKQMADPLGEPSWMTEANGLIEYRYVPDRTPADAEATRTWPQPTSGLPAAQDPSREPRAERDRRAKYREAHSGKFVRMAQKPGEPLRPGQMITVLVRPEPYEHPELYPNHVDPYADVDGPYVSDNDDDDFNVPGWACPTRWC